ncbi:TonB-dependent receptor plug domain-containing protein [Synoicihabitans lomoniglobus]|uniref:TonB-dependent receptor plug domain-containing protein n=1 Tax=Synoicihabitans lomoniglobus TaxID=2909285 RepID=A0AAF0CR92_9BACT|nr:TonB-dependent receptor plug domain-containing protein [Opitutaceae bacterium LMO-M01]WED66605.1 TonB-dependent receptor plug domain-containing protein [Opitutaceae bacterium LMO-M01]
MTELAAFIATETALATSGDLLPTSRPTSSIFDTQSVLDAPRSVTVLTPEMLKRFDIQDFDDLGKIGSGTQQTNYYGVPGSPILRGAIGGVYFDGLQRAYQRNEMPLSFGAFESLDVVKGPAPSHFGAGQAGGYTNLIPKTPYFDRRRTVLTTEIGTDDHYRAQIDTGAPFLLGDRPAAYRVSLTAQLGGTPYDRVNNDFVSLYGSIKVQLASDLTLFTGAEAFRFKSNENAGWNRPTQQLIDESRYVIGEPINIASSAWDGRANRDAIYTNTALVVPAAIVDAAAASDRMTPAQRDAMLNLSDPADRAIAYAGFSAADLATIDQTSSGYQYTPAYFAAGGTVFTTPISAGTVLASDEDFADADNLLYFAKLVQQRASGATLTGQFLLDYIHTNKISTYGYAVSTDQLVLEAKITHQQSLDWLDSKLTLGASARHTHATLLQDFFDEPFSRRDITRPAVSANSVIPVGSQTDPNGVNFWSPTSQGGANAESRLWQTSLFGYLESHPTDTLTTYLSVLATHAPYRTTYPDGVDRIAADDPARDPVSDEKNYTSFSFSPVWAVTPQTRLYATFQYGTSLDPIDGGAIVGKGNFAENQLEEIGVKMSLTEDTLFASLSAYQWEQTAFSVRDNAAQELEGRGVEFELTYAPSDTFALIASVGHQRINRLTPLGFRSIPLTEEQWALYGGQLTNNFSGVSAAPGYGPYSRPDSNPNLEYPGAPQNQAKLHAQFALPAGFDLGVFLIWSDAYWHNFDRTMRLPATTAIDARLSYTTDHWDIALHGTNLTDADVFYGAEPVFSANTLLTKAPGPGAKLVFTRRF